MHERAKHKETKTCHDEESKTDTKKSKRMETTVTRFTVWTCPTPLTLCSFPRTP